MKNRITKHVDVNVNIIVSAQKNLVGILAHVSVRMGICNGYCINKNGKYNSNKFKKKL